MMVIITGRNDKNTEQVERLIGKLSDEDRSYIGEGYWVDSDHVVCRALAYDKSELIGFVDCYNLPKYPNDGLLILAVHPAYRKGQVATRMLKMVISRLKRDPKGLRSLLYHIDADNTKSEGLAKKMGFQYNGEIERHVKEYKMEL